MSRLRVALVTTFYPPHNFGGDGLYVRRFAHALARRNCDVHVLYDADAYKTLAPTPRGELTPLEEPAGVTVTALSSPAGPISSILTYATGMPLVQNAAIDRFFNQGFDVTHFHNVSLIGGPGILSKGDGVKLYTAHEHWLVCPTHILWRHNRELCDGRECVKCQLAYKRPPQPWRYTGLMEREARNIDAFIALSRSTAENHKQFGFPFDMRILPSFLPDLPKGEAGATGLRAEKPYALFVGRLEKLKGLQDIIPAFRKSSEIELVIVGEGEYGGALRDLAQGAPHIRFLGKKAPEDLASIYKDAVAVVMPSVCHEVFPLVALEAFCAGAPIVARDLGPFPEIVEKSGAGFLFRTGEEAHALTARLLADAALRADLSKKARAAVSAHWSETVALKAYFNLVAEKAAAKGLAETAEKARVLASF